MLALDLILIDLKNFQIRDTMSSLNSSYPFVFSFVFICFLLEAFYSMDFFVVAMSSS